MKFTQQIRRILHLMESGKEQDINEKGATRALIAMRGLVPSIKTIGFISAENPEGKPASKEFNRSKTSELKRVLSDGQWGYQQMKGKYGVEETSFFVRNIRKDDLLRMGSQFNQESVIYGERFEEKDYTGMTFQMIYTTPDSFGKVAGEMKVFINRDNASDFYSKIKGRKFMIPFYGVEETFPLKNSGEFSVKTDFDDASWKGGKIVGKSHTFTAPIEENNESSPVIPDSVLLELEHLQEKALNTVGSASYNYRGQIQKILKKYTN